MKILLIALASTALFAQAPAGDVWPALASRVPETLRTALAAVPPVTAPRPPMEILVRVPGPKVPVAGETGVAPEAVQALEVYSRTQARAIGEGLVTPAGDPLVFQSLYKHRFSSRTGVVVREDAGAIVLADPKGARWSLQFSVMVPMSMPDWMNEPQASEEGLKLRSLVLAGTWPQAMDPKLRGKVRRTSPSDALVLALDLLADLERPAGHEAALLANSSRLAALAPRNRDALGLCAAAALAAGKAETAGRLKGWIATLR